MFPPDTQVADHQMKDRLDVCQDKGRGEQLDIWLTFDPGPRVRQNFVLGWITLGMLCTPVCKSHTWSRIVFTGGLGLTREPQKD